MILHLLLAVSMLPQQSLPEEPKPKVQIPIERELKGKSRDALRALQVSADGYLVVYYNSLDKLEEKHPRVPKELIDKTEKDIRKLYEETILDPGYRRDWNEFGSDIDDIESYIDLEKQLRSE